MALIHTSSDHSESKLSRRALTVYPIRIHLEQHVISLFSAHGEHCAEKLVEILRALVVAEEHQGTPFLFTSPSRVTTGNGYKMQVA